MRRQRLVTAGWCADQAGKTCLTQRAVGDEAGKRLLKDRVPDRGRNSVPGECDGKGLVCLGQNAT